MDVGAKGWLTAEEDQALRALSQLQQELEELKKR